MASMDYDAALEVVGGFGRYQIVIFILLSTVNMKSGMDLQTLVLSIYIPRYSCVQPYNSTNDTSRMCHDDDVSNQTCTEWSFDKSILDRTMMTEFSLTCEKEKVGSIFMTVVMLSKMIGQLIGILCDIYGRRKVILILVAYDLLIVPFQAFVPTLEAHFVFRILRGFGDGVLFCSCFYLMELVGNDYRMTIGCNYWTFSSIGYCGTALLGNYIRDYRYVQACALFLAPFFIALCFLMVESPRWLLVKGRKTEAIENMVKMAKMNGKKNITFDKLQDIRTEDNVIPGRFRDCFSSRTMAMKTIIMAIIIWTASIAYNGLSLDGTFASQNIFINIALMGVIEIPANTYSWVIGNKLGRKWTSISHYLVSGIIIVMVPHLPQEGAASWVKTVMAVIGKFTVTAGYNLILVFTNELQPTCIRNVSFMPALLVMAIAGIVAPMILQQAAVAYWIPSVVFGGSCFIGASSLLPLPETIGLPLTQTVREADLLVLGQVSSFRARLVEYRSSKDKDKLLTGKEVEAGSVVA